MTEMTPSRRRLIGAMSLATPFSAAWMAGPALLPFSDLTLMHVAVGLVIPYGIAGLGWGLLEPRARREVDTLQFHGTLEDRQREVVR